MRLIKSISWHTSQNKLAQTDVKSQKGKQICARVQEERNTLTRKPVELISRAENSDTPEIGTTFGVWISSMVTAGEHESPQGYCSSLVPAERHPGLFVTLQHLRRRRLCVPFGILRHVRPRTGEFIIIIIRFWGGQQPSI